jgi:hypothetical protein
MNNIGFGIFCFGENYYYRGTFEKIDKILEEGYPVYILTESSEIFEEKYTNKQIQLIPYTREIKSYHDKMILPKHILKNHDISILIDADTHITDYTFLEQLKEYPFKKGITYVDTLLNHSAKREFIRELINNNQEWKLYNESAEKICPSYSNFETIWEYFLVVNKEGFDSLNFYKIYEKLQLIKEYSDLEYNKNVIGAGEGITIQISSNLSNTTIQKDLNLYEIIKDKMLSVSRRHTPHHLWPNWMK